MAHVAGMPVMRRLRRMGEEIDDDNLDKFEQLRQALDAAFTALVKEKPEDAA
jgi:hypothetical protein